jgi:hypothetical protein
MFQALPIINTFSREQKMDTQWFVSYKKFLNALRYQLKMFKSTLDKGLAFAKKSLALVNFWVSNMNGKNYWKRKEEPRLLKLLKTLENEGATSKYPEYTDIKVSGHILEVFMALKNIFLSDRSCFFLATVGRNTIGYKRTTIERALFVLAYALMDSNVRS